jgi:hypothetical protein
LATGSPADVWQDNDRRSDRRAHLRDQVDGAHRFRSALVFGNDSDVGPKQLVLRDGGGGYRIVREELYTFCYTRSKFSKSLAKSSDPSGSLGNLRLEFPFDLVALRAA